MLILTRNELNEPKSGRSQMFFEKDVLKSLLNFTEKLQLLKDCNFIKKKLQHKRFPVNITKFLRTPFFTEQLGWLLL